MAKLEGVILQHTHDTEENWKRVEETFIPAAAELVIYTGSPNRIKIGDGINKLKDLKFVDQELRELLDLYKTGNEVPTTLEKGQIYFKY